jgi:beta-lactamase regulating signal transducer with metallopeptidase domain
MTVIGALIWLGQSAVLVAVTAAFVRLPACRFRAATRHLAWTVALVFCAALLALAMLPSAPTVLTPAAARTSSVVTATGPAPLLVFPAAAAGADWWLGWAWAVGSAAWLGLGAKDVWRVLRLKRRSVPLSAEEQARLGIGQLAQMSRRSPRLAWCDDLDSPAALGFFRPVIILPRAHASSLAEGQSRLIVLHEIAHVRRGDDWCALGERIVLALTWVNPAMHWVGRELALTREMACDEWVVRQTASPVAYARCLIDVAGLRTRMRRVRLAAGAGGRPGTLRRRIVSVLALDGRRPARAAAVAAWLAPVAVCVVAAGLLQLPPAIGVANSPDSPVTAPAPSGAADQDAHLSIGRTAVPLAAASPVDGGRRAGLRRRTPATSVIEAEGPLPLESASLAPATPDVASQDATADRPPLASSPLPLAGGPVVAAAAVQQPFPFQAGASSWWSRPAAVGNATSAAAVAVGRTTASFFTRAGSRVPQLLIW